jgi:hypothetical protein
MEQIVKTLLRTLAVLLTMMPAANAAEEEYELEFENIVCTGRFRLNRLARDGIAS